MWPVKGQNETDIRFSSHLPRDLIFLFHHSTLNSRPTVPSLRYHCYVPTRYQ